MHQKVLNIRNHQGNKNYNDISPFHLLEWLLQEKTRNKKAGEDVENRELLYTVGKNISWYTHNGKHCKSFSKN